MIAFGTVVYREAIDYIDDLIESINSQDYNDFVVIIINDNISENLLRSYINKINKEVKLIDKTSEYCSPIELRVDLINYAKKSGVNLFILGDCDDRFNSIRIRKIVERYVDNSDIAFFYNELFFFNEKQAMTVLPKETLKIEDVLEYNYLGLSNTAINLDCLTNEFIQTLYQCNSFVFDWYLFSRIIVSGGIGILVPEAVTYYRIHDNNFVGINSCITHEILKKEYEVKLNHYKLMSGYDKKYAELYYRYSNADINQIQPYEPNNSYWWNKLKI